MREVHIRFWIPDSFRAAVSMARYYLSARRLPIYWYGEAHARRVEARAIQAMKEASDWRDKYLAAQGKLIDTGRELSKLKRGVGTGRDQRGTANPAVTGSTPAHASTNPETA